MVVDLDDISSLILFKSANALTQRVARIDDSSWTSIEVMPHFA